MKRIISDLMIATLLSPLLFSCNNEKRQRVTSVYSYEMVKTGILKLPIDSMAFNSGYNSRTLVDSNGKEWLYAIHNRSLQIPVYDLSNGQSAGAIHLNKEGPNGIGEMLRAEVFTRDSILILPTNKLQLFFINAEGKRTSAYNLMMENPGSGKSWTQVFGGLPQLYKGRFYFSYLPNINPQTNKLLLDVPVFAFTVNKDSVALLQGPKYPPIVAETKANELFYPEFVTPSYLIHNGRLIYTIPASDTLYTFDLDTKEQKNFPALSKYKTSPFKTLKDRKNLALESARQIAEGTFYFTLIYDKYRNLYYRINYFPMPLPKNYRLGEGSSLLQPKPISIQIFNTGFNLVGETLMPKDELWFFDYFIGSKGLYISNNNPENPDYDEDSLNYTIYVPEIIK